MEKPIVFISCGQRAEIEKQLGSDITRLVGELTPFQPYFAEYQTSLEGLSTQVLGALNRCAGLVAVLHRRGTVQPQNSIRASVWVEQEIAIAAFLQQIVGRKLLVAVFTESGVTREGLRENLLLNPKEFTDNNEVLEHLRLILPTWAVLAGPAPTVDLSIEYEEKRITQDRHDYELIILLTNRGSAPVTKFHIDLEFPMALLEQPRTSVLFVSERSSHSTGFFRFTQDAHRRALFPGDTMRVMSVDYFVDHNIYFERRELLRGTVRATLYLPDASVRVVEKSIAELQVF